MATKYSQIAAEHPSWRALYAGDCALILEFGDSIEQQIVHQVNQLDKQLHAAISAGLTAGIVETIPTFRSLAVIYSPETIDPKSLLSAIETLHRQATNSLFETTEQERHWLLPVLYGSHCGPDIDSVAQLTGLSVDEIISTHTDHDYSAYMLGFQPGYAFLGDTPAQLHLPRRSEPRLRVPAGSVAIAKQLTGVYPWESPGGWHIIGNCPVPLFDSSLSPPALLKAGDKIRFRSISESEFERLRDELQSSQIDRSRWMLTPP